MGRVAQPFRAFACIAQAKLLKLPATPAFPPNVVNGQAFFKAEAGAGRDRGGSMAGRVMAVLALIALLGGTGLWAWSNYCEDYGLCYPACRVASNGVEYWKRVAPVSGKSDWVAAKASPGTECLALLSVMKKRYPGKQVAIDFVNLANERKPAPFYQYDCYFELKDPVFNLARNRECEASK